VKKTLDAAKPAATAAAAAVANQLLAGDKAVSLVDGSAIPPVTGVSDYDKPMKDGKLIVQFPIKRLAGMAPIIVANNGLDTERRQRLLQEICFYVNSRSSTTGQGPTDLFASGHQPRPLGHARHDRPVRAGARQGFAHPCRVVLPASRLAPAAANGIVARGDIPQHQ